MMFVITIKRIYDYEGKKLAQPIDEYFCYNVWQPRWTGGLSGAQIFKTAEKAKNEYIYAVQRFKEHCEWKDYDKDSVKICELKVELNSVASLPWKDVQTERCQTEDQEIPVAIDWDRIIDEVRSR